MTDFKPLVSIIINTHNSTEYLYEAIVSAFKQTYQDIEVLVYDNASTTNIQEHFGEYTDKIKYYRSDPYLSLGAARNAAMNLAEGDLIDFLDADDIFLPDKLEKQVPFFENAKTGLVYSDTYYLKRINNNWEEYPVNNGKDMPSGFIFPDLLKRNCISFNTAIIRNLVRSDTSGYLFNEKYEFCTDYDLFLKISHDYDVIYVNKPLAKWRDHGSNITLNKRYLAPAERFLTIPRILEYEPNVFRKYPGSMKVYISEIFMDMGKYFLSLNQAYRSVLCFIVSLLNSFNMINLKVLVSVILPWKSGKND